MIAMGWTDAAVRPITYTRQTSHARAKTERFKAHYKARRAMMLNLLIAADRVSCCDFTTPSMTMRHDHRCEDDNEPQRVAFRSRRRRKRPRPSVTDGRRAGQDQDDANAQGKQIETKDSESLICKDPLPRSLSLLLYRRETGKCQRRCFLLHADDSSKRSVLRRSIRYSQLRSPPSEAVLALERNGSYFVSLCGNTITTEGSPLLSLRIYGVPSPAMLEEQNARTSISVSVCPLVQTVPLLFDSSDVSDESASPVATTPVQILVSADWNVGMAFLHHSTSTSTAWSPSIAQSTLSVHEEESLGTLILFRLSTRGEEIVQSYKCSNVRVAGRRAFTLRNLLWETNIIPHGESSSSALCSKVLHLPGYLFLNDEDDGFRMTWVMLAGWKKEDYSVPLPPSFRSAKTSRHDIITKSDEVAWDEVFSKRYCGKVETPPCVCGSLEIAFEAYFRVDALLDDILSHRKETFGDQANSILEFHYNLISVQDGKTVSMVIVFGRHIQSSSGLESRSSSFGVFLHIDIFTQSYEKTGWVRHSASPDASFLRKWSNVLALSRRMEDQAVGPFCHGVKRDWVVDRFDWSIFYDDTNNDYDDSQDADPYVWGQYLARIKTPKQARPLFPLLPLLPPKRISCVSLFPNCELITNDAVRSAKPVASIRCRNSTTEFVYG